MGFPPRSPLKKGLFQLGEIKIPVGQARFEGREIPFLLDRGLNGIYPKGVSRKDRTDDQIVLE